MGSKDDSTAPRASVEPIEKGFMIRIHPDGGTLGDHYDWHCVVRPDSEPGVATIHLAPRAPTRKEREALAAVLNQLGFHKARWERRKGGVSRWTREFSGP